MRRRKNNMTSEPTQTTDYNNKTDKDAFLFDPPLPTLWSNYESSSSQLLSAIEGEEAKKMYDNVLSSFNIADAHSHEVPRRPYGTRNKDITVPLISLGGFVALGSAVMRNRKLKGPCGCGSCCKGMVYFACNGLILPLLCVIMVWIIAATQSSTNVLFMHYGWISWVVVVVLSLLAPLLWFVVSAWIIGCEHQNHLDGLLDYSYATGIDHIETARHYMESEAQLKPVLARQRKKGHAWMIQTKVRCYDEKDALYNTSIACLKTLGVNDVTLLTVHGVNIKTHVHATLKNSADEVVKLKAEGRTKLVGFAAHCHTTDIIKLINTNKFDYVNLHFGFFSSYTNIDNQSAVLAAREAGLGVYCISPSNQGGELHKPSKKLLELCAPLHPLEFGLLYLMTHKGIGDYGTISCGPTDYKELDYQLRAVKLIPYAQQLLPPIVQRLRLAAREELGKEYCNGLSQRINLYTQGNEKLPGALNISLLMGCHGLWKSFDQKSYLIRMVDNLSVRSIL